MFKNKRIVAMVLCALMLFVPVAAMAATAPTSNYLQQYRDAADKAKKAAATASEKADDYAKAVKSFIKDGKKVSAVAPAAKAYEEAVEAANEKIAAAEALKELVESFAKDNDKEVPETFVGTGLYDDVAVAKDKWAAGNNDMKSAKESLDEAAQTYSDVEVIYNQVADAILELVKNANSEAEAKRVLMEVVVPLYEGSEYKSVLEPVLVKAWENYARFLNNLEQTNALQAVKAKSAKAYKVLSTPAAKYEMMSTGEKGWILSDEAKNGCLKDVAEFKVEKKDGKFIAKIYDKNGKEIVLKQQLTVYRPIAKDVKVLNAKVDGKVVTFAISARDGQNYVSVPVIY